MDDDESKRQMFLERYKADRAEELELDKFSGDLERSFLQAAAVLNGGSATVFLSFIGSTIDKVKVDSSLLADVFIVWILGLVSAIIAGLIAHQAQSCFAFAVRARRDSKGVEILGTTYKNSIGVNQNDTSLTLSKKAGTRATIGQTCWIVATVVGVASVLLFGLGAYLALNTVKTAVPVQPTTLQSH